MFTKIWNYRGKNHKITQKQNEPCNNCICLSDLECGNCAKVVRLQGSNALICKLKAMGIFAGTVIEKKSAIPAKGPIIVEKGGTQVALGYEIAEKITVERL